MFMKNILKKIIKKQNKILFGNLISKRSQNIIFPLVNSLNEDINDLTSYIDKHDPSFLKERDERDLQKLFKARLGIPLNLQKPETFNEKLQWLKVHYRRPEMTIMADKYKVRGFLEHVGYGKYLNDLYGVYQNTNQLLKDMDKLPKAFVVKANHWSGGNVVVKDKTKLDVAELKKLDMLLDRNYYYRKVKIYLENKVHFVCKGEWQYKNIDPCLIVEKYLEDISGALTDYKIFCFNGTPHYIQVDLDRFVNHTRCFYDINWNKQEFTSRYPLFMGNIPRPSNLNEMLDVAGKLSQSYPYLRVDFYVPGNRIIFGEFTFYHETGMGEFNPVGWDKKLGELIELRY